MNQEIKKRWVDALRSGKFAQGKNYLHQEDGSFCCLGVLCEVAIEDSVVNSFLTGGVYVYSNPENEQDSSSQCLPDAIRDWADMSPDLGSEILMNPKPKIDRGGSVHLSNANDELEWSFAKIADWIEANL